MTAPLPTPAEVAQMRERHVATVTEYSGYDLDWCVRCDKSWPCDAARLLALVDTLSSTVTDLELANGRIRDRENEGRGRLAAVLAECDRARLVWTEPLVLAERIRRAATGEGS